MVDETKETMCFKQIKEGEVKPRDGSIRKPSILHLHLTFHCGQFITPGAPSDPHPLHPRCQIFG